MRNFIHATRGNISVTTALVGLMLATAAGAPFDTGRQVTASQKLQSLTDAAALAAMAEPGLSAQQRKQRAGRAVEDLMRQTGGRFVDLSMDTQVRKNGGQVYVSLATDVPMLFGGLLGKESRRVSVESTAEEFTQTLIDPLSVSFVVDLSSSMNERFDTGSKIASVRAAMNDLLGDHGITAGLSSGMYGFNWGEVKSETAPLAPGADHVLDALRYVSLGDGSVPTVSMERALEDQITEMKRKQAERFIVYLTDGPVDNEKADQQGRYLPDNQILSDESRPECPGALERVERARQQMAQ
ncbi:MAG: pilus assembly protein TadG-related protein [Pseudomonadota bacterium]